MKKIIKVVMCLLPVFLLNGCASINDKCGFWSQSTACGVVLAGGAVVTAPIILPYIFAKKAEEKHQARITAKEYATKYQQYAKGVAEDDYEQIKRCVYYCGSAVYLNNQAYYDPQLLAVASRKLIAHPTTCITNGEYQTYMIAYLNLVEQQHWFNQTTDDALINQAWQFYQSTAKIAYDPQKNTECKSPAETIVNPSIQTQLRKSISKSPIEVLKADVFNLSLRNINQKEVTQRFAQCPQLVPKDEYDNPDDLVSICKLAYKQYIGANQEWEESTNRYEKAWKEWERSAQNNAKKITTE